MDENGDKASFARPVIDKISAQAFRAVKSGLPQMVWPDDDGEVLGSHFICAVARSYLFYFRLQFPSTSHNDC